MIAVYPGTVPSRGQTPAAFDTNMAGMFAWFAAAAPEMNALVALMNATSGAGGIVIPYTFSTTTTDSDPGAGALRLNQATQNTATVIRADMFGSDGLDKTGLLALFTAATGTSKGYIRLVHTTDATKHLFFEVTAMASPAGYRNITVTLLASSAASPFANNDPVTLYFVRGGDTVSAVGDSAVVVHTGNGHGSTNSRIRRFTTTLTSTGSAITYADSATLGAAFTINEDGIYAITYTEIGLASGAQGLSLNSSQLSTDIANIAVADRLASSLTNDADTVTLSIVGRFTATDVIRAHNGTVLPTGVLPSVKLSIRKVGL